MPQLALAAICHDADAQLAEHVAAEGPRIAGLYSHLVCAATYQTSPHTLDALRAAGFAVSCLRVGYPGLQRTHALWLALQHGAQFVHCADLDIVLHWSARYPDELQRVLAEIPNHDFLIHGRTRRASQTRPRHIVETEAIGNRAFSLLLGMDVDGMVGSRGLSRRAAEIVVQHSEATGFQTDMEWPLLVRRLGGMQIGYQELDTLDWETPDRSAAHIAEAGGLEEWKRAMDQDPALWLHRLTIATEEVRAAIRAIQQTEK